MHTQLHPALCQAWRSPQSLQLGLSERSAAVLDGLTPQDVTILQALADGVHPRSKIAQQPRYHALLEVLAEHGLVVRRERTPFAGATRRRLAPDAAAWTLATPGQDAWPMLHARAGRKVVVRGRGRIAVAIAATLGAAGVGQVTVESDHPVEHEDLCPAGAGPNDLGVAHREVVRARVGRQRRPDATDPDRAPDLVVLVEPDASNAFAAEELMITGVAHLSVVVREGGARIGPLVEPGKSACLRCLDMHRADTDPLWPYVLAQLLRRRTTQRGELGGVAVLAQELASGQLAASWASLQVLVHLDGLHAPVSRNATIDIDLPNALPVVHEWSLHPACGCTNLPEEVDDTVDADVSAMSRRS